MDNQNNAIRKIISGFGADWKAVMNMGGTILTENFMVAGGGGANVLTYSYDGITWLPSTNGNSIFNGGVGCVAFNGLIWVAGGWNTNRLAYSIDGITWKLSPSGNDVMASDANMCTFVVWTGTIWLAGTYHKGGLIGYSYDGMNWFSGSSSPSSQLYNCAATGNVMVAGGGAGYGAASMVYSTDYINWNSSTSGNNLMGNCSSVAWNGSLWVAVGGAGSAVIIYGTDGINWTSATSADSLFNGCSSVVWNGILWVVSGSGNYSTAYSYDGINWVGSSTNIQKILCWNGKQFIAKNGYSTDGITWNLTTKLNSLQDPICAANRRVLPNVGNDGSLSKYYPSAPSKWASPAPTSVQNALDRMATLLYTLNSNTAIP
jgi:hypothetical protein